MLPGLTPFTLVKVILETSRLIKVTKSKLWPSCLDFGPDGFCGLVTLDDGESGGNGKGSQWYGFDVNRKVLVSSNR